MLLADLQGTDDLAVFRFGGGLHGVVQQVKQKAAQIHLLNGQRFRQHGVDMERNAIPVRLGREALEDRVDRRIGRINLWEELLQFSIQPVQIVQKTGLIRLLRQKVQGGDMVLPLMAECRRPPDCLLCLLILFLRCLAAAFDRLHPALAKQCFAHKARHHLHGAQRTGKAAQDRVKCMGIPRQQRGHRVGQWIKDPASAESGHAPERK